MDIFSANPLLVKQPQTFAVDQPHYDCFDRLGRRIAYAYEEGLSDVSRLRLFLSDIRESKRKVVIHGMDGRPILTVHKGRSFQSLPNTTVSRPDGQSVGTIKKKFKPWILGFKFDLRDPRKRTLGTVEGEKEARHFRISDDQGREVARVERSGLNIHYAHNPAGDAFVLRRHYPQLPEPLRTLVVAAVFTIDLTLR